MLSKAVSAIDASLCHRSARIDELYILSFHRNSNVFSQNERQRLTRSMRSCAGVHQNSCVFVHSDFSSYTLGSSILYTLPQQTVGKLRRVHA